jgi:hypothetical protein
MKGGASGDKRALEFIRDPLNSWNDRVIVQERKYGSTTNTEKCAKFWNFEIVDKGGNNCGFDIWDNNKKKYFIEIDKRYNTIQVVNLIGFAGIHDPKNEKNELKIKTNQEYRTPDFLRKLFPDGFYMDEKYERLVNPSEIPDTEKFVSYGDPNAIKEIKKISDKNFGIKFLEYSRDPTKIWKHRKYAAKRYELCEDNTNKPHWVGAFPNDVPCPEKFGPFSVSKWGGIGDCGFNIWEPSSKDATKKNKFWIDVDPIFNVADVVKDETNAFLSVGAVESPEKNEALNKLTKEFRTPDKTPNFFDLLFPNGYYSSETSTELIKGVPAATPAASPTPAPATPGATPAPATPGATPAPATPAASPPAASTPAASPPAASTPAASPPAASPPAASPPAASPPAASQPAASVSVEDVQSKVAEVAKNTSKVVEVAKDKANNIFQKGVDSLAEGIKIIESKTAPQPGGTRRRKYIKTNIIRSRRKSKKNNKIRSKRISKRISKRKSKRISKRISRK